eukprot:GHVP01069300.1.p1 GENE.GHVP01069300.1~~GHVP01069300.1.p1  ORF type:complete len:363 (+),score=73.54 GHVP01069300.1:36-1124(+)
MSAEPKEAAPAGANLNKHTAAASVANEVLRKLAAESVPGKSIKELCELGDSLIVEGLKGEFTSGKNKNLKKGVAFPTTISVNHVCGHFAPLASEDDKQLEEGDVVKIDLGVHIDNFLSVAGHTVIVGTQTDPRAHNVVMAAYEAAEAALRTMRPGKKNSDVTSIMKKVTDEYDCQMLQGVLSHQLLQNVIDGNKVILGKETNDDKVDEFEFETSEVYALDVVVTSGEGKSRDSGLKPTIFKRNVVQNYKLRTQLARSFFHEVVTNHPTLPFHIREFDQKAALVGISECMRHNLVHSFPIIEEKQGEFVAQFKFTVYIANSGTKKLTGLNIDSANLKPSKKLEDPEILALLAQETTTAKKPKK